VVINGYWAGQSSIDRLIEDGKEVSISLKSEDFPCKMLP